MAILDRLPDASLPWPIVLDGVYLLAKREKCATAAYLDWPGRKPTIGFGETENVTLGMEWTIEECDKNLCSELTEYTEQVKLMCKVQPSQNQLAGLVVCTWNIGIEGMRGSSMMRLHNEGKPLDASRAFGMWNKARDPAGNLIEVDELTSRRAAEAALYLEPDKGSPSYPVPQVVAPQPAIAASPTMGAGTAATGIGGVTLAFATFKEIGTQITDTAKDWAADLGLTPVQVLAGILLVVGLIITYRRWRQRQSGIA